MSVLRVAPVESEKKFSDHKGQGLKAGIMASLGLPRRTG